MDIYTVASNAMVTTHMHSVLIGNGVHLKGDLVSRRVFVPKVDRPIPTATGEGECIKLEETEGPCNIWSLGITPIKVDM